MKKRLGITGGIAAGKSTVANTLSALGTYVISADNVSRVLTQKDAPILSSLSHEFGADVINASGELDRACLAGKVFGSAEKLEKLNALMLPAIAAHMCKLADECTDMPVVFDAPLLIEAGLCDFVDEIWLICAPYSLRLERIEKRDGMSRADAEKRILSRKSDEELMKYSDVVLYNTGSPETLSFATTVLFNERFVF